MKRIVIIAAALVIAIAATSHANAASKRMVFWYPGEAGSTGEAQPTIDSFFQYVKENGKVNLTGAYYNTMDGGLNYIRSKKPALGILSNFIWEAHKNSFPSAEIILATLPLPHGASKERYALVGVGPLKDDGSIVYTSEPLSRLFITKALFNDLPRSLKLEQTSSMIQKLKGISQGILKGYAILTPIEAFTLKKIKSTWAQNIKVLNTSQAVPTARLILFDPGFAKKDVLTETLLNMKNNPEGQEILDSLRLTGFAKP